MREDPEGPSGGRGGSSPHREHEPLDGDIGPAAGAAGAAEEVLRHEAEREVRRRRTNAVSGRITAIAAGLLLAFLTYDSVRTAVEARSKGDDWIYPPAVIAAVCATALATLLAWAVRRVK